MAFLCALFALPMSPEQLAIYRECTGRTVAPTAPLSEAWLVCGRRAGKSFMLALVAVFLSCFRDYRPYLQAGERATLLIIAADRKQSRVIFRYIAALLKGVPMLARLIERETAESIYLTNRVTIEVGTASHEATRGYVFAACLLDELAFFRTEDSASPDFEIIGRGSSGIFDDPWRDAALRVVSRIPAGGALWDAFSRHYGKDGAPLVWKAATRTMNPTVPQEIIDEALDARHCLGGCRYLAEFPY